MATTSLYTDLYELTMIQAAREAGVADRRCVFEVFTRSLPDGRRYGAFAGIGRILDALADFRFDETDLDFLRSTGQFTEDLLAYLEGYRFEGNIEAYAEGEVFFPNSPVVRIEGTFEQCVLLETLVLSILNHDSAIASVGSRMIQAAQGRPCIEMGSRRVHEHAAVAASRAAAIVGFSSTSNLEAGRIYDIPVVGTSAHAFTLLFDTEADAFRAQVHSLGAGTSLLVDTFDIREALDSAVEIAGPDLGAVRIDSGNLGQTAREVRAQLDALGATDTRITATSDLDEYRVFDLRDYPLDGYGIGTRLVTGGDHPAQGFVFKLVERENSSGTMEAVAKKSAQKATIAGSKRAYRVCDANGAARAELVLADDSGEQPSASLNARPLLTRLVENGEVLDSRSQWERIEKARRVHERALEELSLADLHIRTGQDGAVLLPVVHSLQELQELSH
ncbi:MULTISPECIES: nicotinate phosphoribosyltransferase [Dermabacter]|uniref:Nicotinate phosphoribosyltransferase n=1 Tax=Dermabacter vaginalis TaxID=1630135 RepID=A0ABX6A3Z2_9MICO|nr:MULTISPECIES: nicotinate phosphoribosyltransferase [Dermabacter]QEU11572.1 nicotinate phosphoribosyltransferase [Dermabacter vaginalis]RUP87479.1 nicotinate phosphoribosyltransferase [Dermabacter sp. HSID17554]